MGTVTRRQFLATIPPAALAGATLAAKSTSAGEERPVNLLFIMTDQQRFDALSRAGNDVLKTPNLDRLAGQGAFFKNAYTPCPVCGPARSSVLSGCSIETTRVVTNAIAYSPESSGIMPMPSFDEILAERGYRCEYYGKWHAPLFRARVYQNPVTVAGQGQTEFGPGMKAHLTNHLDKHVPIRQLRSGEQYDTYTERPYRTDPIDTRHDWAPGEERTDAEGKPIKPVQPDLHGCLDIPAGHSVSALQAKETIAALERLADGPFSLTCSFHYPHAPMLPTEPYYSMYPADEMVPPASIDDPMDNSPFRGANGRLDKPEYRDKEKIKYMISNYYGLVREIDDWVGKILDKLDELGLSDNTLVVFTSDHGEMLGAHGMREKNVFYEESAHIPLMLRLPGKIAPGAVVDAPISLVDLFATILDYTKTPAHPSDGRSLRGQIEKTEPAREFAVSEWNYHGDRTPNLMVRTTDWKYICCHSATSPVLDALYNLADDPHELNNLIGKNPDARKWADQAERMKSLLVSWLESVDSPHLAGVKARPVLMAGG